MTVKIGLTRADPIKKPLDKQCQAVQIAIKEQIGSRRMGSFEGQTMHNVNGGLGLALSGGGAKGAFQVGVIDELVTQRGIDFSVIGGTSTGAIQGLGVAQDTVSELLDIWSSLKKNEDIYYERAFGLAGFLIGEDAMYDTRPLRKLLKGFADEEKLASTGKKLRLGVVNLQSGEFKTIDEGTPDIHEWVYGSCAMPVYFDPLTTYEPHGGQTQWVDGGVRDVTPLGAVLEAKPSAVLAVRASPSIKAPKDEFFPNLYKIALRCAGIQTSEVEVNDTKVAIWINDLLVAREQQRTFLLSEGMSEDMIAEVMRPINDSLGKYCLSPIMVLEPDEEVSDTLEFNQKTIQSAIDKGRKAVDDNWPALDRLLNRPESYDAEEIAESYAEAVLSKPE